MRYELSSRGCKFLVLGTTARHSLSTVVVKNHNKKKRRIHVLLLLLYVRSCRVAPAAEPAVYVSTHTPTLNYYYYMLLQCVLENSTAQFGHTRVRVGIVFIGICICAAAAAALLPFVACTYYYVRKNIIYIYIL